MGIGVEASGPLGISLRTRCSSTKLAVALLALKISINTEDEQSPQLVGTLSQDEQEAQRAIYHLFQGGSPDP